MENAFFMALFFCGPTESGLVLAGTVKINNSLVKISHSGNYAEEELFYSFKKVMDPKQPNKSTTKQA